MFSIPLPLQCYKLVLLSSVSLIMGGTFLKLLGFYSYEFSLYRMSLYFFLPSNCASICEPEYVFLVLVIASLVTIWFSAPDLRLCLTWMSPAVVAPVHKTPLPLERPFSLLDPRGAFTSTQVHGTNVRKNTSRPLF